MRNVKIYGAGSIGNHLAHACRTKGWNVVICDVDGEALKRTQHLIYPQRYGKWDEEIQLCLCSEIPKRDYDVVIVGTPPGSHMDIALHVLKEEEPCLLLVEKPACTPSLVGADELWNISQKRETIVCVGYNHAVAKTTQEAEKLLRQGVVGRALLIEAGFKENWQGIFDAHPWLAGPHESYLGFWQKGGGATGEHSHAINIFQHFSHCLGTGKIVHVSATMDMVKDSEVYYDRTSNISVRTASGLYGTISQDVVTKPTRKFVHVQGENGYLEWHVNWNERGDGIVYGEQKGNETEMIISKRRPDDFLWEVSHLEALMNGTVEESPISLERGLDTMLVVAAAYRSYLEKKIMEIDYNSGYNLDSIRPIA